MAILAMLVVGISAILIPLAGTMSQLIVPHLGLGLGIGVVDAALVPLLASLVDQNDNYGPVYSIQQVAVSLAYSLGKVFRPLRRSARHTRRIIRKNLRKRRRRKKSDEYFRKVKETISHLALFVCDPTERFV